MEFKYHGSYKGFYLLEQDKYKRPFLRLDEEQTKEKLSAQNVTVKFDKTKKIFIEDKFVVFAEKTTKKNKDVANVKLNNRLFNDCVPKVLTAHFINYITTNNGKNVSLESVFDIIENVIEVDDTFKVQLKKLFYYNNEELQNKLNKYFPIVKINDDVENNVIFNYPSQYIIKNVPLDYQEREMVYVFYFIIMIELLTILK